MMRRYRNAPILNKDNQSYIGNVKYPKIPLSFEDIYVITNSGDRFDLLANQYYNNPDLWWIISIANPFLAQDSYFIPVGTQLRIPQNISNILNEYNKLNNI